MKEQEPPKPTVKRLRGYRDCWAKERAQGRQGKSLVMFLWQSPSGPVPARYVARELWDTEADQIVKGAA